MAKFTDNNNDQIIDQKPILLMKNHRFILFAFCLLMLVNVSTAQNDSLRRVWENIENADSTRISALEQYHDIYKRLLPDSALASLNIYLKLVEEKDMTYKVTGAYVNMANIYRDKGMYEESIDFYKRASAVSDSSGDKIVTGIIIANRGNVYLDQLDYINAFNSYTEALLIFESNDKLEYAGSMLNAIANIYIKIENHDLAEVYLKKALTIYESLGILNNVSIAMKMNLGVIEYERKHPWEALEIFQNALKMIVLDRDNVLRSGCYYHLARIHLSLGQTEKAKEFALKNLSLQKIIGNTEFLNRAKLITAIITGTKDPHAGADSVYTLLTNNSSGLDDKMRKEIYECLVRYHKNENEWELAFQMHEKLKSTMDKIQAKKGSNALLREVMQYEIEIEQEKKNSALKLYNLKRDYTVYSFLLVALLILIRVVFLIKHRYIKRRDELLNEIEKLKSSSKGDPLWNIKEYELSRIKIESSLTRKLNDTDWNILQILQKDPVISNSKISERAFLSIDGVGSSLRRMYDYFEVKESKYKKISLVMEAVKYSKS